MAVPFETVVPINVDAESDAEPVAEAVAVPSAVLGELDPVVAVPFADDAPVILEAEAPPVAEPPCPPVTPEDNVPAVPATDVDAVAVLFHDPDFPEVGVSTGPDGGIEGESVPVVAIPELSCPVIVVAFDTADVTVPTPVPAPSPLPVLVSVLLPKLEALKVGLKIGPDDGIKVESVPVLSSREVLWPVAVEAGMAVVVPVLLSVFEAFGHGGSNSCPVPDAPATSDTRP